MIDLGCGEGRGSRGLRALGHRVVGADHSPTLTRAAVASCPAIPVVRADAAALRLADVRLAVPELSIEDPGEFAARLLSEMPPRPANYEAIIAVNAGTHPFDPELETGGNSCSAR